MQTFKLFDVVKVPFPFTDITAQKRRPAVIISKPSFQTLYNHCILCIITSAKHSRWEDDIDISNLETAGLSEPSVIQLKIFTLDVRL